MTMLELRLEEVSSARRRRVEGKEIEQDADVLSKSLTAFMGEAWSLLIPRPMIPTWHLQAISEHLEAAYAREIPRLLITIQPGAFKSSLVSVLAPAWRWTSTPEEQIVSASHTDMLATRDTRRTRQLIASGWYQARWPHVTLTRDENMKTRYSNTRNGWRVVTHVGGGTGERGGVLILDDPHNAQDALSTTETGLQAAREWIGNTWSSRLNSTNDDPGVKIVIGQRVHENDVIGFLLDGDEDASRWVHLCLPARYEKKHQFVYPAKRQLATRTIEGDPRTEEGQLLAPDFMNDEGLAEVQWDMSERTKQAQYQQNPTPREGAILKRADWRYFPRRFLTDDERHQLPAFRMIVNSWDTSFKAKVTSDKVAGAAWGVSLRRDEQNKVVGQDMLCLNSRNERMSLQATKDAMKEMRRWCLERWPLVPFYLLIERSANGVEIIEQLQREIDGVIAISVSGDKKLRAEAASPALESHNLFMPGDAKPDGTGPDANRTDAWVMEAIEQTSRFTGVGGEEDDWVDQLTQAVNWVRTKDLRPSSAKSASSARIGAISGIQNQRSSGLSIRRGL